MVEFGISNSVDNSERNVTQPEPNVRIEAERNTEHPFQDFLYALRERNIPVSTREWLDFQIALNRGLVRDTGSLYIIARTLLVKDVSRYREFDVVFEETFLAIRPPEEEQGEEEEPDDRAGTPEELDLQKKPEEQDEGQEKDPNQSQEIVEPGSTEEHHGGTDVHKEIKESQSSGSEGGGSMHQYTEGSLLDQVRSGVQRQEYGQFDETKPLRREQLGRAVARLVSLIEEAAETGSTQLDAEATVQAISQQGGHPEFRYRVETETKPKLLVMFDVGGSTDRFRPLMEQLFLAIKDYVTDVDVYYFHNAIYGEVWPQRDGNYGTHFVALETVLARDPDTKVIIIGDAKMGYNDSEHGGLHDSYNGMYQKQRGGCYGRTGYQNFEALKKRFPNIVWINPIHQTTIRTMREPGTIRDIQALLPMHDLSLQGIEEAVTQLLRT